MIFIHQFFIIILIIQITNIKYLCKTHIIVIYLLLFIDKSFRLRVKFLVIPFIPGVSETNNRLTSGNIAKQDKLEKFDKKDRLDNNANNANNANSIKMISVLYFNNQNITN